MAGYASRSPAGKREVAHCHVHPLSGIWKLPADGLGDRYPRLAEFKQKAQDLGHKTIGKHTRLTSKVETREQEIVPIYLKDLGDDRACDSMNAFSTEDIAQVRRLLNDVVLLSEEIREYFNQFGLPRQGGADAADNPNRKMSELGELKGWRAIAHAAEHGSSSQYRGEIRRQLGKFFTADRLLAKFSGGMANANAVDTAPVPSDGQMPVLSREDVALPTAIGTSEPVGSFLLGSGHEHLLHAPGDNQGAASGW